MQKILTSIVLFFMFATSSSGQIISLCDSLKVYRTEFDKVFQQEFAAIKADTILAIRHCYSTNGCSNTYGILCWKLKGNYYFKKINKNGNRINSYQNLDDKLKNDLISFFEDEVYLAPNVDIKSDFYINDGPFTKVIFKTPNMCWNFNYSYSSPSSSDKRIIWVTKLESFAKIEGTRLTVDSLSHRKQQFKVKKKRENH